MLIEINKIIKKEDQKGQVYEPKSGTAVRREFSYDIHPEGIRVADIESYRNWFKNDKEKMAIPGDITVIMKIERDNSGKQKVKEVLIAESFDSFSERLNAIKVENIQEKTAKAIR